MSATQVALGGCRACRCASILPVAAAQARQHFEAEATLLAAGSDGDPEDDLGESEAFEFLMDEVATTSNFDRLELQRFVARWWLGHVRSMASEGAAPGA